MVVVALLVVVWKHTTALAPLVLLLESGGSSAVGRGLEAYNRPCNLLFYCWRVAVAALLVVVWKHTTALATSSFTVGEWR